MALLSLAACGSGDVEPAEEAPKATQGSINGVVGEVDATGGTVRLYANVTLTNTDGGLVDYDAVTAEHFSASVHAMSSASDELGLSSPARVVADLDRRLASGRPIELIMLMDASCSMGDNDSRGLRIDAARGLVDVLLADRDTRRSACSRFRATSNKAHSTRSTGGRHRPGSRRR
jgi:hypothetical protein